MMKSRNWFEIAIINAVCTDFLESENLVSEDAGIIAVTEEQASALRKVIKQVEVFELAQIGRVEKKVLMISCVKHNRK
jgi:hypothetical protein